MKMNAQEKLYGTVERAEDAIMSYLKDAYAKGHPPIFKWDFMEGLVKIIFCAIRDRAVEAMEEMGKQAADDKEQLRLCREDWQKVCDAIHPGRHFNPEEVVERLQVAGTVAKPAVGVLGGVLNPQMQVVGEFGPKPDVMEDAGAAFDRALAKVNAKDAKRFRWLATYPNLYTVIGFLRSNKEPTLELACDKLMEGVK